MQGGKHRARTLTHAHIGEHYDDFSWVYRRYWGDHIHHGLFRRRDDTSAGAQESLLRYCAERAAIKPGMTVVDVGCGHGATARFLAHQYSCSVLGISISETQIQVAQKSADLPHRNGKISFELANAETYSFPAAHFDVVWNMESSEHFFDKGAYFKKVAAALKPGGTLMVAAWTGSMEHGLIREIAEVFLCPELLTAEQYTGLMETAGLSVVSSEELGPQVARTWDLCAEQARGAGALLSLLPKKFRRFADSIELMRRGYATKQLSYSVMIGRNE